MNVADYRAALARAELINRINAALYLQEGRK